MRTNFLSRLLFLILLINVSCETPRPTSKPNIYTEDGKAEKFIPADSATIEMTERELEILELKNSSFARSMAPSVPAVVSNYPTDIKKVFQIESFENCDYSKVITDCPYIFNLCKNSGTIFDNFWSMGHPSQPNYMRNFFGVSIYSDNTIYPANGRTETNLYTTLKLKGKSWSNFIDGLPSVGYLGSYSGTYAPKHDAARYASTIDQAVRKPLNYLPTDLNNLSDGVIFISPDLKNSGHDTGPGYADNWAKTNPEMQRIINYVMNPANKSILVFNWDEGSATNQIFLGIIGYKVKKGFRTTAGLNQYDFVNMKTDLFQAARINIAADQPAGITMNQWVASDSVGPVIPPVDTIRPPVTPGTNQTAFRRAAALKDGFNYPWMEDYKQGNPNINYINFLNLSFLPSVKPQIQLMNVLGFEHVRTPFAGMHFGKDGSLLIDSMRYFTAFDSIYVWAKSLGMKVVFDLHDGDLTDANYQTKVNRVIAYWKIICNRMKYTDPETVLFEIMNEPNNISAANWKNFVNTILPQLRTIVPNHTFIVGANEQNSLYRLPDLGVVNDTNVIYNFHFYEPVIFTHAGAAPWAGPDYSTKWIPYPYNQATMPAPDPAANSTFVLWLFGKYSVDGTYGFIRERISWAINWAAGKKVPIYMGETGCYKEFVTKESRCNYTTDVKKVIDEFKFPYAYWEWRYGFSPFIGPPSVTSIEPCMVKAMGIILPSGNVCWRTDTVYRDSIYAVPGCGPCSKKIYSLVTKQVPCPLPLQPAGAALARFAPTPNAVPDYDVTPEKLEQLLQRIIQNNKQ